MRRQDSLPAPKGEENLRAVLVVEDEALLRVTIADHLNDCGYLILEACNAHDAIVIITSGVQIDLVFTDVKMPGEIDGFGLAKWIRENRPDLAVFVASGYSGTLDLAQELCGGEQFFSKPYNMESIAGKIRQRLASRSNARH